MEQLQATTNIPHIVQVYQSTTNTKIQNPQLIHISHPSLQTAQGKVTYQQTITSESLHIPVSQTELDDQRMMAQNQIVMSCQSHLQTIPIHAQMQTQMLQGDITQPLQISSHVILPQVPVFKQHLLVNSIQQQYYGQYEYEKEQQDMVAKVEPELQLIGEKSNENKSEDKIDIGIYVPKKRARGEVPNPNKWACNIRKQKHQRGEAYISRRGKYVPERQIKTTKDCLKSCRFKCNERISDTDREHLFKAFYSLDTNGKKYFILNTTERQKTNKTLMNNYKEGRRRYSFKYFFLVRGIKYSVCKNFYLGTLAISQKPVYNVHLSKSEMNVPKPDGRGLSEASGHGLPSEMKDRVRKHIMSFKTIDSKPFKQFPKKKQYLGPNMTIKQMHSIYESECIKENLVPVKESMYRKIAKQEFNIHVKKIKTETVCCKCKSITKKK